MKFSYSDDITCITCGSQEITLEFTPAGIGYCTCKSCGKKFIIQSDGVNIVNGYLAERGKIFKELEGAKLNGGNSASAKRELENLIKTYSVLADKDPVYYWYKTDILTDGFRDLSKFPEAEKEYLKVPKENCFFVNREDVAINEAYLNRFDRYRSEYEAQTKAEKGKKLRKKKTALISVFASLGALLIGAGLFTGLYSPVAKDGEAGVRVSTLSCGIFDKFSATAKIDGIEYSDAEYETLETALSPSTEKFAGYEVNLLKDGKELKPKSAVEVILPVPEGMHGGKVYVYSIEGGKARAIKHYISDDGKIIFETKKMGLFAVAELPCKIYYDANGAEYGAQFDEAYYGELLEKPQDPARRGYTFSGWLRDGKEYDFSSPVTRDMTLSAKWSANSYSVKYYDGGNEVKTQTVVFGETVKLHEITKRGYTVK